MNTSQTQLLHQDSRDYHLFSAYNLLSNVQDRKIKKSGCWGPSKGTPATRPVLLTPPALEKSPLTSYETLQFHILQKQLKINTNCDCGDTVHSNFKNSINVEVGKWELKKSCKINIENVSVEHGDGNPRKKNPKEN